MHACGKCMHAFGGSNVCMHSWSSCIQMNACSHLILQMHACIFQMHSMHSISKCIWNAFNAFECIDLCAFECKCIQCMHFPNAFGPPNACIHFPNAFGKYMHWMHLHSNAHKSMHSNAFNAFQMHLEIEWSSKCMHSFSKCIWKIHALNAFAFKCTQMHAFNAFECIHLCLCTRIDVHKFISSSFT